MKPKRPKRRPIGYPPPTPPSPPKRRLKSFLVLCAIGLFGAGTLAVQWTNGSTAFAQANENIAADKKWAESDSRGMREVLDALKARERALDRREQSLISREADLRSVERDLEARIEELKAARTELEKMLKLADKATQERISALVKMVESMRSQQAADMVAELPDDLAVAVLDRMKSGKAGKLLAKMKPLKAAGLAQKLANEPKPLSNGTDAGGD